MERCGATGGRRRAEGRSMSDSIYLDYNTTTPVDPEAVEAMLPWLKTISGTRPAPTGTGERPSRRSIMRADRSLPCSAAKRTRSYSPQVEPSPTVWPFSVRSGPRRKAGDAFLPLRWRIKPSRGPATGLRTTAILFCACPSTDTAVSAPMTPSTR